MKCSPQLLSEYFDGELPPELRGQVESHLQECPDCAAILADYGRVSTAIKGLPRESAPPLLAADLDHRLSARVNQAWWRRLFTPALELSAVAVTALVVFILISGLVPGFELTSGPVIAAATPGTDASALPTNATIKVTFHRPMNRASVEAALSITPALQADYLWAGNDLYVVPKEPLKTATTYHVAIDSSAQDDEGHPLDKALSAEFATVKDDSPQQTAIAQGKLTETVLNRTVGNVNSSTPVATTTVSITPAPAGTPTSLVAVASGPQPTVTPGPPQPTVLATPGTTTSSAVATDPTKNAEATGTVTPSVALTPTIPDTRIITVTGGFGLLYEQNDIVRQSLGDPISNVLEMLAAEQPFQRGYMLWRANTGHIFVLSADGQWSGFDDTWTEVDPDPTDLQPPTDMCLPSGRFGKVWGQNPVVKITLGWGLGIEHSYVGAVQEFAHGTMFRSDQSEIYVLYADGTWEKYLDTFPGQ